MVGLLGVIDGFSNPERATSACAGVPLRVRVLSMQRYDETHPASGESGEGPQANRAMARCAAVRPPAPAAPGAQDA